MSSIDIYDISVLVYIKGVTVLIDILKKALIDDMLPLSFHVQSMSNTATKSLKKLMETDIEGWEDNETTMEQLIARAEKTLALLEGIDPKALEGRETTTVNMPMGQLSGKQFIFGFGFGMPNFFFHLQNTYAILRMKGVPLGKADYLTPWNGPWSHS
ncbi:hypothetical protein PT974_02427 [Cladobotryum mycophilum]|uniref:Uncharacterized protein n=1 Tax=Cladobotryum mycophilum TaxID=491253 RepID=A0ABR0SY19_9HYPO